MGWRDLNLSYGYILAGILVWSTQAFVSKMLVTSMGFLSVYFFASLFTSITAFACYLIVSKGKPDFSFLKEPRKVLVMSVFLTLANFLLFASFGMLSASNVVVMLYMYPIFMSVLNSVIMKKDMSGSEIAGLAMGFVGIFIFATNGNVLSLHIDNVFANVMILTAALAWAAYLIVQKKYNFDEFGSNSVAFALSVVYVLPLLAVGAFLPNGVVLPGQNSFLLLLYFSVVTFALGNVVYVKGLKKTKTVNTALLSYLTPVIAVVLDYLILNEKLFWYELVPIVFIFFGYAIINIGNKRQRSASVHHQKV